MKSKRDIVAKKLQQFNKTCKTGKLQNNKILKSIINTKGEFYITPPFYCETGNIELGNNVFMNTGVIIVEGEGEIEIGDNALIGPNVHLYAATHKVELGARNGEFPTWGKVKIGNDVWIGGGSIICSNVTIGDNAVIGAGSVVVKDIPANTVAVGNPCKPIKTLE